MVSELTKPESPPQFMAKLSVTPHSESATIKKEAYEIFYHIYAGEDKKADYTVFLRNRIGDTYYATEKCGGRSGEIAAGGISTHSLDCVTDSGYDEVCVTINGITECGFGKVTSAFSLNYLNDLIVEDEATKGISTEEECIPDNQRYNSPVQSIISGGAIGATGIVRVCSIQNPGQGTNPESWKTIGTCGKDTAGRSIGSCWIDLRTVSIHDTERMENTQRALQEAGLSTTKISQGATYLLDKETSEAELARLNSLKGTATTPAQKFELMQAYTALQEQSLSLAVAAEAQYQSATLLGELSSFAIITETKAAGILATDEGIVVPGLTIPIGDCETCQEGVLGGLFATCSLERCHGLGKSCFFASGFKDKCFLCHDAEQCEDLNDDLNQCESDCTQQAGLNCKLGIKDGATQCIEQEEDVIDLVKLQDMFVNKKLECISTDCRISKNLIKPLQGVIDELQGGEKLVVTSAHRTLQSQKGLFIRYLDDSGNIACRPDVKIEPASIDLPIVQDINSYKNCPHVKDGAIDITLYIAGKQDSRKLETLMCNAEWIGYAAEIWHYEYETSRWKTEKAKDSNACLYGTAAQIANRENIHVP